MERRLDHRDATRPGEWSDQRAVRRVDDGVPEGAEAYAIGPVDAGTSVLLVHGFMAGPNTFGELPRRLAERGIRVRVMRLAGHGTDPLDLDRTSADQLLAGVRSELDALRGHYERVVVVGHSMGGALSLLAVALDGADGLVLAAPYFEVTHRWYFGPKAETWARWLDGPIRWIYKSPRFMQVNRAEARERIFTYRWVSLRSVSTLAELGSWARRPEVLETVPGPVLVLQGIEDGAASPDATREVVEQLGVRVRDVVWLPRSNHHVFWDYERDLVVERIVEFVTDLEEPPVESPRAEEP